MWYVLTCAWKTGDTKRHPTAGHVRSDASARTMPFLLIRYALHSIATRVLTSDVGRDPTALAHKVCSIAYLASEMLLIEMTTAAPGIPPIFAGPFIKYFRYLSGIPVTCIRDQIAVKETVAKATESKIEPKMLGLSARWPSQRKKRPARQTG